MWQELHALIILSCMYLWLTANEWQEIIDMCDYAVGLSRQLNGSVIPSERKICFDIILVIFPVL